MFDLTKTIKFGKYIQGFRIFGKNISTPIDWYVLEQKDKKFFLLSKYCLSTRRYHEKDEPITWEKSTIRKWLNNENDINDSFILNAFSKNEIKKIMETKLQNPGHIEFNTIGGNDTIDKVFILSIDEYNKYLKNSDVMYIAAPTKHLINEGTLIAKDYKTSYGEVATCWWLRSPGYTQTTAMVVTPRGVLHPYLGQVNVDKFSLRIALWVDMSK